MLGGPLARGAGRLRGGMERRLGAGLGERRRLPNVRGLSWTPAKLGPERVLWLDAANADTLTIVSGNQVDSIADPTGAGTAYWNSIRPLYEASGFLSKPCMNFAGGRQLRTWPLSTSSAGLSTFFAVSFGTAMNSLNYMFDTNDGGGNRVIYGSDQPNVINVYNGSWRTNNATFITAPHILHFDQAGATGRFWRNGVQLGSNFSASTLALNSFGVFNDRDCPTMRIAEVIMISGVVDDLTRQRITDYLMTKWGIA